MDENTGDGSKNTVAPDSKLLASKAHSALTEVENVVDNNTGEQRVNILPEDGPEESATTLVITRENVKLTHGEGHLTFVTSVL